MRENVEKTNFYIDSIMKMYYALSEGDDMHDEQNEQCHGICGRYRRRRL